MSRVAKTLMKAFGGLNVGVYRASGGNVMGKIRGAPVLLLTVPGRKTGAKRTTPVCYIEDAGRFVVAGSAGGAPSEPQWFRNLRAADESVIEVGRRRMVAAVDIAEGDERERLWQQLVSLAPMFSAYQAKVERQIPLAVLTPNS